MGTEKKNICINYFIFYLRTYRTLSDGPQWYWPDRINRVNGSPNTMWKPTDGTRLSFSHLHQPKDVEPIIVLKHQSGPLSGFVKEQLTLIRIQTLNGFRVLVTNINEMRNIQQERVVCNLLLKSLLNTCSVLKT